MIPIAKPMIGAEEKSAVVEVLDSGILAQGKKVAEFEQQFAKFIGVQHAIATSNGTTALHAALLAHGIKAGDEVITSPFSFVATANAIRMCNATSVFVDIDEKTFNINPDLIEAAITSRTKAILPVHLFGFPAAMDKIRSLAKKYNLAVIEDACQAHGAEFQGQKVGSFGTGCFSFYPTKNMTTGEGGMITTNDDKIAAKLRKIINHGSEKKYYHESIGYNYRMMDIAAAIGIEQLKKLPAFNQKRRENASYLNRKLQETSGIVLPPEENHVFHQYTIRITDGKRAEIKEFLEKQGVATAIFYPLPIHRQEAYPEYHSFAFPIAEKACREVLSLPVHPTLTIEDLNLISTTLKEALQ